MTTSTVIIPGPSARRPSNAWRLILARARRTGTSRLRRCVAPPVRASVWIGGKLKYDIPTFKDTLTFKDQFFQSNRIQLNFIATKTAWIYNRRKRHRTQYRRPHTNLKGVVLVVLSQKVTPTSTAYCPSLPHSTAVSSVVRWAITRALTFRVYGCIHTRWRKQS